MWVCPPQRTCLILSFQQRLVNVPSKIMPVILIADIDVVHA